MYTVEVTFNIVAKSLTDSDISVQCNENLIKNNKLQKPLSKITYNGSKLGKKDYKAEYFLLDETGARVGGAEATALQGVKDVGTYEMVITGQGNYTGVVNKTITVFETGTYMNKTNVTLTGLTRNSITYTGEAIEPAVEVRLKDKEKTLLTGCKEGETNAEAVYTVSYDNNVNVGTAKVTVTGIPSKGYFGSVTKTFKITGVKLSSEAEIDLTNWQESVAYDVRSGKAVQPVKANGTNKVTLKLKAGSAEQATIKEGKDYTVSYLKNDKPGTATMVFTGIGKYTGTITKTFKVTKVELSTADTKLKYTVADTAAYAKKGAKATVTVKYDGVKLVEGKDYKLTYKNNKALTVENMEDAKKPQVTITGIGAFTGKILNTDSKDTVKDTTFAIVKADLSALNMTAADVVFKEKKSAFMVKPVLTDASGTKLALNKDYTVKYYLVTADGDVEKTKNDIVELDATTGYATIKVVATAAENSNYVEGSTQTVTYRVVKANVASASVKIKAQVYTGKEVTLSEKDFEKMKVGKENLTLGKDFEIVKDSYSNNINKGTASVTIKGIGNYGGTKKVTFKITSRTMAWWWNLLP